MNESLATLMDLARTHLALAGIVFLRVGAAMALLPAFGSQMVPARVRLALALALTAAVTPAVAAILPPVPTTPGSYLPLLFSESLNGLCLGFILRLMVMVVEMAGTLAAQSFSLSQAFGAGGEPMPAIAHLLTMAALALAMLAGLHVRLVQALIQSYDALPAGHLPGAALIRDWSVGHIAAAFGLAFSLAAPFIIAALLFNVALGLINKAMPSLMVSFLGAPALSAAALVLAGISGPLLLGVWHDQFRGLLAHPFRMGAP